MRKPHCGADVDGKAKRRTWPGGYIHQEADGRDLFIIERKVGGRRFHKSTRCHSLRAAMKQLEAFEANPADYNPAGAAAEEGLFLTAELADAFWEWQVARGVSRKHANAVGNRLEAWIVDLEGVDLRKASLRDHIKPALERRGTMRGGRISTLKSLYAWLRKEKHLLTSAEDTTLDMPVPQAQPEKHRRRKAVPFESVQAVAPLLEEPYRNMLAVLAATGWHVTELERFIHRGDSDVIAANRGDTLAVLVTWHKGKEYTRTPVREQAVLAAALYLRARRKVPKAPNAKLAEACVKAGVPVFTLGVMRHSVATWSIEAGAVPALVSEFLGHRDPRTTKRFYSDVSVPTVNVPLPRLLLVKS